MWRLAKTICGVSGMKMAKRLCIMAGEAVHNGENQLRKQ
jgi:hypothetical protein